MSAPERFRLQFGPYAAPKVPRNKRLFLRDARLSEGFAVLVRRPDFHGRGVIEQAPSFSAEIWSAR